MGDLFDLQDLWTHVGLVIGVMAWRAWRPQADDPVPFSVVVWQLGLHVGTVASLSFHGSTVVCLRPLRNVGVIHPGFLPFYLSRLLQTDRAKGPGATK